MFFEYKSKASSDPCGQQGALEENSSFDLGFFLVSRPDVVGAGLQTHSLQCFPLSYFFTVLYIYIYLNIAFTHPAAAGSTVFPQLG